MNCGDVGMQPERGCAASLIALGATMPTPPNPMFKHSDLILFLEMKLQSLHVYTKLNLGFDSFIILFLADTTALPFLFKRLIYKVLQLGC